MMESASNLWKRRLTKVTQLHAFSLDLEPALYWMTAWRRRLFLSEAPIRPGLIY